MAYTGKFWYDPFAVSGDQTSIPDAVQPGGQVSIIQGYGPDYSLDPGSNPSAILVERQKFNYLMYIVTQSISVLQTDFPQFVAAAQNNGSAFSYNAGAVVRYTDGNLYQNTTAANTLSPPGNGWVIFLSQYALQSALNAEIARAEAAEALLAPITSPNFLGTPTAPTASPGTTGNALATLNYVISAVAQETVRALAAEALLAPLLSPGFAGSPTAPTAAPGTNNTLLATCAFVTAAVAVETSRAIGVENTKAPLISPAFSGVPTCPTPPPTSDDTTIPNTAWVRSLLPSAVGNLTVRYANLNIPIGGSYAIQGYNWNSPFPSACLAAVASAKTNDVLSPGNPGNNFCAITYSETVTGGVIRIDTEQGRVVVGNVSVDVIGVGI